MAKLFTFLCSDQIWYCFTCLLQILFHWIHVILSALHITYWISSAEITKIIVCMCVCVFLILIVLLSQNFSSYQVHAYLGLIFFLIWNICLYLWSCSFSWSLLPGIAMSTQIACELVYAYDVFFHYSSFISLWNMYVYWWQLRVNLTLSLNFKQFT